MDQFFCLASFDAWHPNVNIDDYGVASIHGVASKRYLGLDNSVIDLCSSALPDQSECSMKARSKAGREQLLRIGSVPAAAELGGQSQVCGKITVV
ncbi:hypothetical protein WL05_09985 [Burkholderia ubonensis]|nr:hypothetical protein WJ51_22995 [Burkholderia ubonensis]KVM11402.1 hypothetical protein WJ52_21690 [Burkholderia ubonensis]KVM41722.1 hypothetical protein WJ56_31330 [Burkholderia ubonensis]KVO26630.1 hypothetical protein WJ72_24175 [Burkholderia ubonensis]KVX50920.1 hypothetical protein WL05_09985 [Burkholderia ubonensis]